MRHQPDDIERDAAAYAAHVDRTRVRAQRWAMLRLRLRIWWLTWRAPLLVAVVIGIPVGWWWVNAILWCLFSLGLLPW